MKKQARRGILLWLILAVVALVLFLTDSISRPVAGVFAVLLILAWVLFLGKILLQLLLRD